MKANLSRLIDRFSRAKILVLGDFLLDEFVFGEISRISREAPVLILDYRDTLTIPGGGANTVSNLEGLGVHAIPVGFVGDDRWAEVLLQSWPPGVERRFVFCDATFQTTRKKRILAGSFHSVPQQVVRLDYENPCLLQEQHEKKLSSALKELVPEVDAIIVSDYHLGNISPAVWQSALILARQHGKIIVADSRKDLKRFKGATSVTPNITEIEADWPMKIETDITALEKVGTRLREEWDLAALLVTRGKLGMTLFEKNRTTHIPTFGNDEVADVTGAGDTVVATYTTALSAGGSFQEAARLANCGGGIVVMKRGTAAIAQMELRQAIAESLRKDSEP